MSDSTKLALSTSSGRDRAERLVTFVRSNSSVIGAFIVIGGLFLAQRYIGAWLTDASVIDESDIPPVAAAPAVEPDAAESCEPWVPTFSDEFDGNDVDDGRWILFNSPDRDGNGVRRPEAITVEDGLLVITGGLIGENDGEVVAGAVASRHQQVYGRFEARVRTEADPSETMSALIATWPAGNNHPDGGQNDLYDTLTSPNREPFYSYIHHPDTNREEIVHNAGADEWHELAMEWTPDAVTVLRDDEIVGTVTERNAIANVPHVLTLQLMANNPDMDGRPVRMYVDWVRVYRANDPLPAGC